MRRWVPILVFLLVIAVLLTFVQQTPEVRFSGIVVDPSDTPIAGARVQVGDDATLTDAAGYFEISGATLKTGRYLFNVRKTGYGLLSRRYSVPRLDGRWVLTPGTIQEFPPDAPIGLADDNPGCAPAEALRADFPAYPRRALPRLSTSLSDPQDRAEVANTLQFLFGGPACSPGARVEIPAGSLVDSNGAQPKTAVTATVATVDRYAPDAMAGEGDVVNDATTSRIESYGAVTVTMESGGQPLQLAPGKTARISVPVHATQRGDELPASIPFLLYDETQGIWTTHATAELDKASQSYVATVTHLSTYNTDLVKDDQTCLRINANPLAEEGIEDFELDVFFPVSSGAPEYRNFSITYDDENNDNLHAIINLPSSVVVTLVASYRDGDNVLPIGIYATNTGGPMPENVPNDPPYPYAVCSNVVTIEPPATGEEPAALQLNGSAPPGNVRPWHTYILVKDDDIYPVGSDVLYAFGLFDTGADRVVIPTIDAQEVWNMPTTGPEGLEASRVSVRVSGLARINPESLLAPGFNEDFPAELEVSDIALRVDFNARIPLIGTPVTNAAIVEIKPYTTVTRGPYPFQDQNGDPFVIEGMDLKFLDPSDELPTSQLSFELEPIERNINSSATIAPIPALRNVIFEHEDAQFSDIANENRFLFDTGTQFTIIGPAIITALGLEQSDAAYDCFSDRPGNEGFIIDRLEFADRDNTSQKFRVAAALVCADFNDNIIVLSFTPDEDLPRKFDAVIGMAPFINTDMLLHGPEGWLGISPPEQ
ncbi:MAG: carboxypeptidase-like regulatory domain-containing protein [Pseudomonadota bacterium]